MTLDTLLQRRHLWRGGQLSPAARDTLPTGFRSLDTVLAGGWPQNALTEILSTQEGIGELRLVLPSLAHLSRGNRWITWIAPPRLPYAPALAAAHIELSRILLVRPRAELDALWAIEQALRSGTCATVLAWPRQTSHRVLRRLQLAAEAGKAWGILFRHVEDAYKASPAALRLRLESGSDGLAIQILKYRGNFAVTPTFTLPLQGGEQQEGI
ncbi:MAG: translesion DNA synthesis-associated protein ImuA [Acidiferrobacterales bacterium]